MGTLTSRGEIDPSKGVIITCLGKKRSGKSKMALLWFESYPYDRVVIDVNGTDGPHRGVIELRGTVDELPTRWPEHLREDGKRMTLRYHPDAGSPTFVEDVDAVLGMAYRTGRVCVLLHEVGLIARANRTPPHMLRILQSNRHRQLTVLLCCPRPHTVDPLVLGQSDLVYVFELPNPADRKRVAEEIGWDPADFAAGVDELGPHEYLRADTNESRPVDGETEMRLVSCPALPADVVAQLDRL
ncbi:hypothetical protein C5N14_30880 [Micromonospora sp. MW-13]|uniref:hypothetical protein n=1 Tax=Micromonospora sp. MW-13 TaxID=2094022 RepID=UPI000E4459F2|nr:hypothetical protein [Micromonospora sp. MW-13]RGC64998.1 hypothetical protein C5N14_30880 [Micromonospora sp. MW-13]